MIDTIVNSFEIWTDAQGIKSRTRVNNVDNISLEGIARLRELILDLAVSGKLVPHDPNEEPAFELLKKIEIEKKLLIKEGKLSIQKKQLPISEEEELFKLPQNWEWVRLTDIGNIFNGNSIDATTKESKYTNNKGIPYIATKDLGYGWDILKYDNGISIPEDEINFKLASKGSVLICAEGGSAGKKCGITNRDIYFGNKLFAIELFGNIPSNYILSNYLSSMFSKQFKSKLTGIIGGISIKKFSDLIIPLPPLSEQIRIVAKVDELIAFCDKLEAQKFKNIKTHQILVKTLLETLSQANNANELEAAWLRMSEHFEILFCTEDSIEQLKQMILQLAIMGKLVKQDPNDEHASGLLKKIAKEKERLVKEGKIKDNILPEVTDEQEPFRIPQNWKWVRLGNITNKLGSGSTPRGGNNAYSDSGVLFLRSQNIRNEGLLLDDVAFIDDTTNMKMSNTIVYPNDILLNITGGSLGRCTIFPKEVEIANVSQHVTIIRPNIIDSSSYLHSCILSPYIQGLIWGRQIGANREGLSKKVLEQFEIPYPPIAEQKRIVYKIGELFALCDTLLEKLQNVEELKVALSKTIIEKVVS